MTQGPSRSRSRPSVKGAGQALRARFLSAVVRREVISGLAISFSPCGSVPFMGTLPASDSAIDLRAVTVRPTWGAREHRRWDRLVEEHHYLRFHGVVGKRKHKILWGQAARPSSGLKRARAFEVDVRAFDRRCRLL